MKNILIYGFLALWVSRNIAMAVSLDIPENLWQSLSTEEKLKVSSKFEVQLQWPSNFGLVIDSQILNKSTSGTNGGSRLGAAYGQANYIDRAFTGSDIDYSAKKQLGAGLLGSVVGSIFDRKAEAKFVTRHTIKTFDNQIRNIDESSADQGFLHPNGVCVVLNPIRPASQELCGMTKKELMLKAELGETSGLIKHEEITDEKLDHQSETKAHPNGKVKCKIGNNPLTFVDKNLCINANGEIE